MDLEILLAAQTPVSVAHSWVYDFGKDYVLPGLVAAAGTFVGIASWRAASRANALTSAIQAEERDNRERRAREAFARRVEPWVDSFSRTYDARGWRRAPRRHQKSAGAVRQFGILSLSASALSLRPNPMQDLFDLLQIAARRGGKEWRWILATGTAHAMLNSWVSDTADWPERVRVMRDALETALDELEDGKYREADEG
ncbi:hypothetical protein ACTJKO_07780 [Curtobacterium sp. 22159]|uniref:hypothetical protein n=1 Tax=Curtobacterium sp. 22159 TaxID=3453882 RepID=UPI003F84581F